MLRMLRKSRILTLSIVVVFVSLFAAIPAFAGDPTGTETYQGQDAIIAAIDFVWVLVAAFLVMFMQAGFALLEAGLTRAKNTVNILTKNVLDFGIGGLAYWAFGFAFMFGAGNAFIGLTDFFLAGNAYDVTIARDWLFQVMFAAAAATIVSGAMAERTKVTAYLAYSFIVSAIIYPIYGHWVWGGGWLGTLGAVDFAGSGVVHAVGGTLALVGAWKLGPRIGKYDENGEPQEIPAHNMVYVILGVFVLFFGWFGFNAGSTLSGTDLRIAVIAANTALAAIAGGVAAMYIVFIRTGRVDVGVTGNGILAGLVGITAPCAYVAPWAAVVIGAIGGIVMLWVTGFVERTLKIDDPVGAFAVHGAAGIWGVLAVGIFADGTYGVSGLLVGDTQQIVAQAISVVALLAWTVGTGYIMFSLLDVVMGLRVTEEQELQGLDASEHGLPAYGGEEEVVVSGDVAPAGGVA